MLSSRTLSLRAALLSFPLVSFLVAAAAPCAHAQTFYLTSGNFLNNVQANKYTETFSSAASTASSYSFSANGFGYTVTSGAGNTALTGSEIETNAANQTLTITFTTGNVTAVGGNFYDLNAAGNFSSSGDVNVVINYRDGTSDSLSYNPATINAFRGVTYGPGISSLVFAAPGALLHAAADNLIVGQAAPEPGGVALLGVGALPLIGATIRRRKNV